MDPPPIHVKRHESESARWEMVERAPHAGLGPHVRRYSGYQEHSTGPFRRREPATADAVLIISFGPSIDVFYPEKPACAGQRCRSFFAGLDDGPALTEYAGSQHGVQVDLTPLGAHMLLGVPMHEVAGRVVELDDLLGVDGRRLVDRLYDAPGWTARFELLDAVIAKRLGGSTPPSPDVAWAWSRLKESHGGVPVGKLTEELGCSRRHLARFREQVGMPPKRVGRVLRFERVIERLGQEGPARWTDIALDCGYYDQSHFNRDFRELAGITPSEYMAALLPGGGGIAAGEVTSLQDLTAAAA